MKKVAPMVTEFEKECLRDAREFFEGSEDVMEPYIIGMHPHIGLSPRLPVGKYMKSDRTKDELAHVMMAMVLAGASEVIFVSEIWRAKGERKDEEDFLFGCQKWREEHGSLEGYPGIGECLMFTHYSDEGDRLHFAFFDKKRKLGRWQDQPAEDSAGRFTNIFKRARVIQGN